MTTEPALDLDGDDVRLLVLWSWTYAKDRTSFAHRHVLRLVERNKHLFSDSELEGFGFTLREEWVSPRVD